MEYAFHYFNRHATDGIQIATQNLLQNDLSTRLTPNAFLSKTEGAGVQSLRISSCGDREVVPQNRVMDICFKSVKNGKITVKKNGEIVLFKKKYGDCARVEIVFEPYAEYEIAVEFALLSKKEERVAQAFDVFEDILSINE